MAWHLAQFNIAHMVAPLDQPVMKGFVDAIEHINEVAAGFYLATVRRRSRLGDPRRTTAVVNMSVWESAEALERYVYRSDHIGVLRRRKEWFLPIERPSFVLWWVPAGHLPKVAESRERLQQLAHSGPTATAFTFRETFSPPEPA